MATTTLGRQHGLYSLIELWRWSVKFQKAANVAFAASLSSRNDLDNLRRWHERVSKASQYGDIDGKLHQTEALPPRNLEKVRYIDSCLQGLKGTFLKREGFRDIQVGEAQRRAHGLAGGG